MSIIIRNFVFLLLIVAFSCKKDKTLFSLLKPNQTGIDFANTISITKAFNAMKFEYIYNGGGVAVADFNNDGLQDMYFTGNQVSSQLYLNNGNLKFENITRPSNTETKAWCTGVTVVDINQDGWQDIYVSVGGFVTDSTKRANLLFENQGVNKNGTPKFIEKATEYGLNDMGYSTQAAFFDYDRDGDLDCYVLTNALEKEQRNSIRPKRVNNEASSTDRLYRNNAELGVKKFSNVSTQAGITIEGYGLGLAISDINGDGWEDIYCANDFFSNDLLWINNQNGTFTNKAGAYLKHQSHNGMGVDIADINNDTKPDIMVLDMLPETNERQKMMLAGSNHDKLNMGLLLDYQPQFMRNTLQLNQSYYDKNGSIGFSEIAQLAGVDKTDWSWAPLFADVDNDGLRDLLITNGYRQDVTNMDFVAYLADGNGPSINKQNVETKAVFEKLKELPQIKLANYGYHNNGNLTFQNATQNWGLSIPSFSNGAAYADFDNDGDLDYVVNNIDDNAFFYENTLNINKNIEANWLTVNLIGTDNNKDAIGAKVKLFAGKTTQYLECQPTRGYVSAVQKNLHFGLKNVIKIDSLLIYWPNGTMQLEKNIKVNQSLTVVYNSKTVKKFNQIFTENEKKQLFEEVDPKNLNITFEHQEFEYNDFDNCPTLPHKLSRVSPCLAVADINGDELDDFFVGNDFQQQSGLYIQQTNGKFKFTQLSDNVQFESVKAEFFDADSDGDLDLYILSGGSHSTNTNLAYQDHLYVNNGFGSFKFDKNALPSTKFSGGSWAMIDFDLDDDLDIFRGSYAVPGRYGISPDSYLLINESTKNKIKFSDKTALLAENLNNVGMITASKWAFINDDKWPDLVLAGEWTPILVAYHNGKKLDKPVPIIQNSEGWWQSLDVSDIDLDGDTDLVLGNIGKNTKYAPSPKNPVKLYAKDFDSNGQIDPIMSFYLGENEVPIPSRDLLMLQITALKRYFPSYLSYSKASMANLFNDEDLASSLQQKMVENRSGWLENLGKGKFQFNAFCNEAQFSNINTIVNMGEYFLLMGNTKAPETIGGWWDAGRGLVIKKAKKSKPKLIENSGLIADYETRDAKIVKRKNDSILIIASINKPLKIFKILP